MNVYIDLRKDKLVTVLDRHVKMRNIQSDQWENAVMYEVINEGGTRFCIEATDFALHFVRAEQPVFGQR